MRPRDVANVFRYLAPEWQEVFARSGMTKQKAMKITARRYNDARSRGYSRRVILLNRLDNPYSTWDAYLTILSDMEKRRAATLAHTHRHLAHKGNWPAREREIDSRRKAAA